MEEKYSLIDDGTVWEEAAAKAIVGLAVVALAMIAGLVVGILKLAEWLG